MTDFRALCAELDALLNDIASTHPNLSKNGVNVINDLSDRARTALAQPKPVAPTDEELLELMPQQFRDDLATVTRLAAHGASPDLPRGIFRVSLNTGALDYARAVLARWGQP
jgi:hypothetical protein